MATYSDRHPGTYDRRDVTGLTTKPRPPPPPPIQGPVNHTDRATSLPLATVNHTYDVTKQQQQTIDLPNQHRHIPTTRIQPIPPDNSNGMSRPLQRSADEELPSTSQINEQLLQLSPKPQRTRTRRERMAESTPPPPTSAVLDPELRELKHSIHQMKLFEESLFWEDPYSLDYLPDSSLYPGATETNVWPNDQQSTAHAKKILIAQKLYTR